MQTKASLLVVIVIIVDGSVAPQRSALLIQRLTLTGLAASDSEAIEYLPCNWGCNRSEFLPGNRAEPKAVGEPMCCRAPPVTT
jgi:hypothetical protein